MKFVKITIYSSIFLISLGFFNYVGAATEVVRTIKPSGQGGDYTSLAAWEAGEQRDLVAADEIAVAQIDGVWSAPDTTAVVIDGWTIDATRYVKIYTTAQARHVGKWDTSKYRIQVDTGLNKLAIMEDYTRIIGLQVETNHNSGAGINITNDGTGGGGGVIIDSCIIKALATNTVGGIQLSTTNVQTTHTYIINNIVYGPWAWGIYLRGNADAARTYAYNNTVYGSAVGFRSRSAYNYAKNNLAVGCVDAFLETNEYVVADYNAYDEGADPGINGADLSVYSDAQIFADIANSNFHLISASPAKNAGTDISGEGSPLNFNTDIDGQSRPAGSAWDIGADEAMGAIMNSPNLPGGSKMKINMSLTDKMTDGLVGMWSFDGADMNWADTSSEAKDRSGNNNHGDVSGATATIGKRGQGLGFDGSDSVSLSNDVSAYLNMTNGSIAFWYKTNSLSGASNRIFNFENNGDRFELRTGDSSHMGLVMQSDYGTNYDIFASIPNVETDRAWHFVVVSWDVNGGSETLALTIDGVRTTDSDAIATPSAYGGTGYVGSAYGVQNFWNGAIDEFRVYDRALSATEVGDLYNLGQVTIRR